MNAPQPGLLRILARDANTLRRELYTPDYHRIARLRNGSLLILFHSICTGSADGHCQAVDVFLNSGPKPVWRHQYDGVLAVSTSSTGFSVQAVTYAPGDPLCCSSLPPVVDTYTWTGKGFRRSRR